MTTSEQKLFNRRNAKLMRWAKDNEEFKKLDVRKQRRYACIVSDGCALIGKPEWRKQGRRAIGASY